MDAVEITHAVLQLLVLYGASTIESMANWLAWSPLRYIYGFKSCEFKYFVSKAQRRLMLLPNFLCLQESVKREPHISANAEVRQVACPQEATQTHHP